MLLKITGGRVLIGDRLVEQDLLVRDGQIVEQADVEETVEEFDAQGKIVAPGFIEGQLNGAYGWDFTRQPEGVSEVARHLPKQGVTAFLPTLVSSSAEVYRQNLPVIRQQVGKTEEAAEVLGIHLEGPFIARRKRGAHKEGNLPQEGEEITFEMLEQRYESLEHVRVITLAPELPGACEVIEKLVKRGMIVSLGHSVATELETKAAFERGASMVTHLYNAQRAYHHREVGIVGATLARENLFYSMICDGAHLAPTVVANACKINPNMIATTDAMAAAGLQPGKYQLGEMEVTVEDDRAVLTGTDTLAGGTATMDKVLRFLVEKVELSVEKALIAISTRPAQMLGIADRKGSLSVGKDADIVVLDGDLNVVATWVRGVMAFAS